jgi:hypothetical protein
MAAKMAGAAMPKAKSTGAKRLPKKKMAAKHSAARPVKGRKK